MPPLLVLEAVELKKEMTVLKNGLSLKCQHSRNSWSKPLVRTIQGKNHSYFVNASILLSYVNYY